MAENFDKTIFFSLWTFSVNSTLFFTWVVMGLLILFAFVATRRLSDEIVVTKFQTVVEWLVMTIQGQIYDVSQDNPKKYMSLVGTMFLFILTCNLLTFIPWFDPPTGSLSTTAAFALCVFVAVPVYAVRNAGFKKYIRKFIEPVPFMLPLNIVSDFSSVFSLAVRLYGNIFSGVMIGMVLMTMVPFIIPVSMQLLGLLTGAIQAYIFSLLTVVYLSSVEPVEQYVPEKIPLY
jgi:F-type H+-transporting ATPase subunit a